MASVSLTALKAVLAAADYPIAKDDLVVLAEQSNAAEDVQKALRSLPPVDYANADEVIRSVTVDVGSGSPRRLEPDDRPTRPGVSEDLR